MKKAMSLLAVIFVFLFGVMIVSSFAQRAPGQAPSAEQQRAPMGAQERAGWGKLMSVNDLKGTEISNMQGEKLGDIDDIMVDPQGRIAFVTLGRGGVLGMGEKKVAIPYQALSHDPEGKKHTLNMSKDKLANAPSFEKQEELNQARAEEIYRFFGVQPYWTSGAGERAPMRETQPGQRPMERPPTGTTPGTTPGTGTK
jgi:sporulation protein YlmC with PRC-barrel domain